MKRVYSSRAHKNTTTRHGSAPNAKQALVIALNYEGSPIPLGGCEVDGYNMTKFFESRGYDVTTLSATVGRMTGRADMQPTRCNIIAWMEKLSKTPGLQKMAIFYAGHGSQLRDTNGDEKDGMDECLVCQNPAGPHRMPGSSDMYRDDDILSDVRRFYGSLDIDLFLMFDACHSGTICDLGWELTRDGKWIPCNGGYLRAPSETYRLVCFSAAQDNECALEAGSGGGLMTNKFLASVRKGNLSLEGFNTEFSTMSFQRPQISAAQSTDLRSVFGDSILVTSGATRSSKRAVSANVAAKGTRAIAIVPPSVKPAINDWFSELAQALSQKF